MHPKRFSWVIFLISTTAGAIVPCLPRRLAVSDGKDVAAKAMEVVLVDEDDRKNARDFGIAHTMTAEAVESRYAATGDFMCPTKDGKGRAVGQAQLTVKNNVLTTVAHTLVNGGDCRKKVSASECEFVIRVDGKEQRYPVASMVKSGYKCPHKGPFQASDDWAVLKLKNPVDSKVKAYGIRKEKQLSLNSDTDVVAVGKSGDWPPKVDTPFLERPRHYGDCQTKYVEQYESSGAIETNCDWSHGASGGSLLTPGANPVLLGVVEGETETTQPNCDPSIGRGGHDSYHQHCWMNQATPVAGEFQAAILSAAGEKLDEAPQINPRIDRPLPGFKLPPVKL